MVFSVTHVQFSQDLFCLSKRISSEDSPTLAAAFEEKARSTHKLVAAFVQLSGANPLKDEIYRRYQRSQTEVSCSFFVESVRRVNLFSQCTALRSELELIKAKLKDCLAQRDLYYFNLTAAETRLDRLQSHTVQAVYGRATSPVEAPAKGEEVTEKEEAVVKEEERASSSPAVSGQFIGGSVSERILTLSDSEPADICARSPNPVLQSIAGVAGPR
jgi:hypothetical protein